MSTKIKEIDDNNWELSVDTLAKSFSVGYKVFLVDSPMFVAINGERVLISSYQTVGRFPKTNYLKMAKWIESIFPSGIYLYPPLHAQRICTSLGYQNPGETFGIMMRARSI